MPGRKFLPRHRCYMCGKRGRIQVEISDHVHPRYFCGESCIARYQVANPDRVLRRI